MVQVYEKPELENIVEHEEVFIVIPEKISITVEKKEEQKLHKKLKLFKTHKKAININNVKRNLDTKMYTNRLVMR